MKISLKSKLYLLLMSIKYYGYRFGFILIAKVNNENNIVPEQPLIIITYKNQFSFIIFQFIVKIFGKFSFINLPYTKFFIQ